MYKRILSFFSALVLCAGITLGSLSFISSSATSEVVFPISEEEVLSNIPSDVPYWVLVYSESSDYFIDIVSNSGSSPRLEWSSVGLSMYRNGSNYRHVRYSLNNQSWSTSTFGGYFPYSALGTPTPFSSSGSIWGSPYQTFDNFTYSFTSPPVPLSRFFGFQPFYFPELPYGYFDGHINSLDGSFNLDYPSSTITGSINQNGFDTYSLTLPNTSSSGEFNFNDTTGIGSGWFNTTTGSGTISQTAVSTDTITLNVQDVPITYQPSYNETARFRTWAVVSGSSYCYFVCDTRNTITGSLESVSGDTGILRFSAVGADGVHYPFYCIEFFYDGTKLQTLSALPNGFTVSFKGGTLEQDSDTGIYSCDPLYHGFWLSDGCPPVVLSSLTDETYKWLANPVFGESAFTLNFLNAINESINNLNQSVTSSISSQTSAFQNMDAPSNFDPTDVNNMLEYGSLESDFQAPSTDDIFSVDSGTFTDGMGFWRDRMNELLFFSGSPALPMTIFSLTLGLAVLIIGRRVSGGGAV